MMADGVDVHANRAETAVMLAIAPELVVLERIESADDPDRTAGLVFRYTAANLSRNGVTGRPSEATAELGKQLFTIATEALVATVERASVEAHRSPDRGDGVARRSPAIGPQLNNRGAGRHPWPTLSSVGWTDRRGRR